MVTSSQARGGAKFAVAAAVLMAASAAISAYWATGGTGLLDTVGGSIARWGRQGGLEVRLALALIVSLKLIAAWLPLAAVRSGRLVIRRLAWLEAAAVTVYGGALTGAGFAVQAGLLRGHDPDWKALDWHAYLWDPWFLVAGVLGLAALRTGRAASRPTRTRRVPPAGVPRHTADIGNEDRDPS